MLGNWMFEAIQDLTVKDKPTAEKERLGQFVPDISQGDITCQS